MTYFNAQSQKMQELLAPISALSLIAVILSLVIGFCIPFFLAPYYPPMSTDKAASSGPSGPQSSTTSGAPVKVETGVPDAIWMTYLVGYPWYFVPRMASSALLTLCLLCGILALGLTSKKPYGLRTFQLILLLLMGPLRTDVSDYDPKQMPSTGDWLEK